ncbi:MAG: GNAT family N-acetyltransferase [Oscillospiraceae bacterium]|nr:GNAT family N-acetyltransferase [Oscillospiraceae bacterium]
MKVRPASKPDIPSVLGCVRRIKNEYFEANNINQWVGDYPSREIFASDVDKKALYVMYMGEVLIGFGSFLCEAEPTYEKIDGAWLTDGEKYLVVHRLGINPDWHGMGMGTALMGLADKICEVKKIPSIRVDTHEDNISMQKLLEKCGFTKCGTIYLENGDPRIAYEKVI